ncbi:MAG: hypothetical protein FWC91_06845 [Defluviitaleaceae bacterium]|nr:hypothetical protein [Defluviitaleaceae bacterium]
MKNNFEIFFDNKIFFYVVLLIGLILRYFPFGFQYFAVADDYSQLGMYSLFQENIWSNVVAPFYLYALRPLAGLTDAFIISRFWGNLSIILLIMMLIHFTSLYLLEWILEKSGIAWGRVACIVLAFYPTTESVYWISASSRIVVSAFFAVLAVYAMLKFIYKENAYKLWLVVALICGILAQGYYEQGIIFSFVLTFGILFTHRQAIQKKIIFAWPFVNLIIIAIHYLIFWNVGLTAVRTQAPQRGLFEQIALVFGRIYNVYITEHFRLLRYTIRVGIMELFSYHIFLFISVLIISLLLALFLFFQSDIAYGSYEKYKRNIKPLWYSFLAGLVLFACTFSIFFLVESSFVYLRSLFFPTIGMALLAQIIWKLLKWTQIKAIKSAIAFGCVFILISASILEVKGYRDVERYDHIIVNNLIKELNYLEVESDQVVWLFNVRWIYSPVIAPHITSPLRLTAFLEGYTQTLSGQFDQPLIMPVLHHWNTAGVLALNNAHPPVISTLNNRENALDLKIDILLGLDYDLNIRILDYVEGILYFRDTGAVFGRLDMINGGEFTIW